MTERFRSARAAVVLALAALFAGTARGAAPPDPALRSLAVESNPEGSVYRIGLDARHRVVVESDRPYRVLDADSSGTVWKEAYRGETAFVADG